MDPIGYAYLIDRYELSAFYPRKEVIRSTAVTRVVERERELLISSKVLSVNAEPLEHLLFAIKHEGINLQILAQLLPKIPKEEIESLIGAAPSGKYLRKLGYLWELFCEESLAIDVGRVAYADLFDAKRYLTGVPRRNAKWKIVFNGIGSPSYCPTVEKTPRIEAFLQKDLLGQVNRFLQEVGPVHADRALQWAYLSETESSFEIEGETAGARKSERFMKLLRHAHEGAALSEAYLCELQQEVVSNPFNHAFSYRTQQNWLRYQGRGAYAVTYVPPKPDDLGGLMEDFVDAVNGMPKAVDPIVSAAVASFGFVYLHPFLDGNGRLSRFLFHRQLCESGQLHKGLVLPVSVAMKANEEHYLTALSAFSKPCRALWDVTWVDGDDFDMQFNGTSAIYRYWDATEQVEFSFQMAEDALKVYLRDEVTYLQRFDRVTKVINECYDLRQNTLANLVNRALENNGVISKNLRKKYVYEVEPELFDAIESAAQAVLTETIE